MLALNYSNLLVRQNNILTKYAIDEGDNLLPEKVVDILNRDNVYICGGADEINDEYDFFTWVTLCFFTANKQHYKCSFRFIKNSLDSFKEVFQTRVQEYFSKKPEITDIDFIDLNLIIDDVIHA